MRFVYGLLVLICVAAVVLMLADPAFALRVTAKRVVFEGGKRAETLTIVNNTAEETTYRLGWQALRMTEEQGLVPVPDGDPAADLRAAHMMIKFSPRRVVLAPGASQQVRMMLRRSADLPDGEYRSHLAIEPETPAVPFGAAGAEGAAIQIRMMTGMTLPVIVRAGDLTAQAAITGGTAARRGGGAQVALTIEREGNRSLYGDLDFTCNAAPVHSARGVAVYTEVARRRLRFDIRDLPADCPALDVAYKTVTGDPAGADRVMATFRIPVR